MTYPKLQASILKEHKMLPLQKIAHCLDPQEFVAVIKIPKEIESKPTFSCQF
jgi:hypothetical protein